MSTIGPQERLTPTREENKANRLGGPMERRIFPEGKDGIREDGGVAVVAAENIKDAAILRKVVS